MNLGSFLFGFLCPFAVGAAVFAGRAWWRKQREVQADGEELVITGAQVVDAPLPAPLPQDPVTMGRIRFNGAVPGPRRWVRGRAPDRNGRQERPR